MQRKWNEDAYAIGARLYQLQPRFQFVDVEIDSALRSIDQTFSVAAGDCFCEHIAGVHIAGLTSHYTDVQTAIAGGIRGSRAVCYEDKKIACSSRSESYLIGESGLVRWRLISNAKMSRLPSCYAAK